MDPPHYKFFHDRHIDRALSKLQKSFSQGFKSVKDGLAGVANVRMAAEKIKVNRSNKDAKYLCLSCGNALRDKECENCFVFSVGNKMGWCYFVIDHFEGDDYKVIFCNHDKFNEEEMSKDIGRGFELDIIGPYVVKGDLIPQGNRKVKRKQRSN